MVFLTEEQLKWMEQNELLLKPNEIIEALKEANKNYKPSREHYLVLNSDIELRALLQAYLAKVKQLYEQHRLDRPDREKIAKKLYQQRWYEGQPTWENSLLKELFRNYADQLLALTPDEKEIREQEKDRILAILQKEYPAITTWPCWPSLKGGT